MLDAIAQTLAEQTAKPVPPANVGTQAVLVAPQQTVVPVLKPTVSEPESIPSVFPQTTANASQPTVTQSESKPAITEASTAKNALPSQGLSNETNQIAKTDLAIDNDRSQLSKQATAEQRLVLEQKLADIVARERPLKEAKQRAHLEAMVTATAQEGQFAQARRMAHDAMLSPEGKAALLAQISAIEVRERPAKPTLARQQQLPKAQKSLAEKVKGWVPTTPTRSLPSALQFAPQSSPPYSYVASVEQQYVSYSLNGFGRSLGGVGIIVDDSALNFSGQNWTAAYETGSSFNPAELWKGLSFIFPLAVPAPITSGFGWRVHPIRGDRRFHKGTDIGAPMGTPVLAAADGKVTLADQLGGYGLTVTLSHQDDTRETLYAHLSALLVKPGQWVKKGDVIGRVGSTGLSTGPHLHFELRQKTSSGWQAIDPGAQLKYALARLVKALQAG